MIELKDVHVNIPLFHTGYSRAIRTIVGETLFGGRLSKSGGGRITVNALRGISLRVNPGDRLGLVGRNGAGKTTILRVIAGILPVSSGTVHVEGDVRTFFNLTAGLDLTRSGLANIESMSLFYTRDRAKIRQTLPSVVEFAELGEFIEMPVYSYSAGMQARLIVAIATAYGGDNIILDEMLGAGDAKFLKKVEARLEAMLSGAQCVVIASHSWELLRSLCNRCVWLENGIVKMDGDIHEVSEAYKGSLA